MSDSFKENIAKLAQLLEFPCNYNFKVIGGNRSDLVDDIIVVVQEFIPDDYRPTEKISSGGKYRSVTINVRAEHIDHIEILYKKLAEIPTVKMVI